MRLGPIGTWFWIAALGAADLLWGRAAGLGFVHWAPPLAVGCLLAGIGLGYGLSGRSRQIAAMANWISLWIAFSYAAAMLTYLAAMQGGPLQDYRFAASDSALGFDWTAWYGFVAAHRLLRIPLTLVYYSLLPQIVFSVFWFCHRGWHRRNAELLGLVGLALLLTTALFHLLPALGPCVGVPEFHRLYVDELIALRQGTLAAVDALQIKGIIAFPSFHAVLACLFAYAHRNSPMAIPAAVLNGFMLLSIPSEGGHYLTDVIAGIGLAATAILASRAMPGRWPALGVFPEWRPVLPRWNRLRPAQRVD